MRSKDDCRDELFSYVSPESRIPLQPRPLRPLHRVADEALKALDAQFDAL
jgi:hypothetical protein